MGNVYDILRRWKLQSLLTALWTAAHIQWIQNRGNFDQIWTMSGKRALGQVCTKFILLEAERITLQNMTTFNNCFENQKVHVVLWKHFLLLAMKFKHSMRSWLQTVTETMRHELHCCTSRRLAGQLVVHHQSTFDSPDYLLWWVEAKVTANYFPFVNYENSYSWKYKHSS
jgi:hypothetical protein